jgi:DNA-binding response OmpR family regulator
MRLGKDIDLRPKEFLLLEYLVRNVNRTVTRTMILEHVWNSSFEGLTNVVDVYISSLRTKVDRDYPQKLIQTNRGIGYTLTSGSIFASASNEKRSISHDRAHFLS